ncbi:MAG: HAMP domain-containing protein [Chloroflexi bacterium]|nr:HAMP domain-containing protein [Chloroflexota bacterium]
MSKSTRLYAEEASGNDRLSMSTTSLRAKVTAGVVLPLVFILGLFTAIQYQRQRDIMLSNLSVVADYSAQVVEDNLLHQMRESDFEGVQELVDTISRREEFEAVYILNTNGEVIFAPTEADGNIVLKNQEPDCQPCHQLSVEDRPGSIVVTNAKGQRIFRSMAPIENSATCAECHEEEDRLLGLLLTDMAMDPIAEPLMAFLQESLLWSAAAILITILVVNLVLNRFVLRRLQRLSQAITDFGRGRSMALPSDDYADEIGQLTVVFRDMARRIEKRRQENQILSERLHRQSAQRGELLKRVIQAQEDERKRVARELHDDLGQTMGGLAIRAEVLSRILKTPDSDSRQQLKQIQWLISTMTTRMYEIILDLRPSALDDLGLVPALRGHAQRLLEHDELDFTIDGSALQSRLPVEIETAIFRIVQEALNNTVRHAKATQVRASLACTNGVFTGEIVDNGQGFDPETIRVDGRNGRGLGLLGMQERVSQCGGQLEVISKPGQGTRITIWIPLSEVCCD